MLLLLILAAPPPPSSAYVLVKNQGVSQGYARQINCSGSGITCAVNTTTAEATLTVSASGSSDAGSSITIPNCAAGYVLDADGGVLYCINTIANATLAATATALAANPTDCSSNQYATAIAANGNLTCATVTGGQVSGAVATATALAADPTDCSAGQYATSIAASGNLGCATIAGGQISGAVGTAAALAANPADCSTGQYATTIAASGDLTCTAVATSQLSGTITNAQLASLYSGVGACGTHTFASTLVSNSAPTCTQPATSDLSGQISDAQLDGGYSGVGACSAHQWASTLSRNASPTCTQPAYTDLSGTPIAGGAVPQVQYNADGGLGGMTNFTTDGVRPWVVSETSPPSAPGANTLHYNHTNGTGFPPKPETIDSTFKMPMPVGLQVGPALSMHGSTGTWLCQCHYPDAWQSSNITSVGSGTATSWALFGNGSGTNVFDAGSLIGRIRRTTQSTATTANSTAGARYQAGTAWLGNAPNAGGFTSVTRFSLAGFPASRFFCGFWSVLTVVTTAESSSLANSFYVGADGPDTNLHICSNDSSGSAVCNDLGNNYPKTAGFYELRLAAVPNNGGLAWSIERLDVANSLSGFIDAGSDMPIATALLSWQCTVTNTDAGQVAKMDFGDECQCANW